jgi:hypothetical protein
LSVPAPCGPTPAADGPALRRRQPVPGSSSILS